MAKVKVANDGNIDFVQAESLPTNIKKLRQSPEIEGFYRFVFENDLRVEAYDIIDKLLLERKVKAKELKAAAKKSKKQ
jgi:hypothetical protein